MIKVGITGQSGFIGSHLYNTLGLNPGKYIRIPFFDEFFNDSAKLEEFVCKCDVIIHLAAVNRHKEQTVIYQTNIDLVSRLIKAMENTNSRPRVLFSSSIQEELENVYGKSKKEGRRLLEAWAEKNKAKFTGLIIPNVFGPFGQPYYNSVVATFCYQLTHNETPEIEIDGNVKLIYVGELVKMFMKKLEECCQNGDQQLNSCYLVPHSVEIKVTELLKKLKLYKNEYLERGIIPALDNPFDRNLFNTFVCYIDHKSYYPLQLKKNTDNRGSFIEMIKLNCGGQVSFSTTVPGVTRGNHFHTRKAERFIVIKGKARVDLRRIGTSEVISFELGDEQPSFIDMPVWYTHNITNIGEDELYTIFWINEFFNPDDPDTYSEVV